MLALASVIGPMELPKTSHGEVSYHTPACAAVREHDVTCSTQWTLC